MDDSIVPEAFVETHPLTIRSSSRSPKDHEKLDVSVQSLLSVFESSSSLANISEGDIQLPDIVQCAAGYPKSPMLGSIPSIHLNGDCIESLDSEINLCSPGKCKKIDNKLFRTLRSVLKDRNNRWAKCIPTSQENIKSSKPIFFKAGRSDRNIAQHNNESTYDEMLHGKPRKSGKVKRKDSFKKTAVLANTPTKSCLKRTGKVMQNAASDVTNDELSQDGNQSKNLLKSQSSQRSCDKKQNSKGLCRENWVMCTSFEADTTDTFDTSSEDEHALTEKNTQYNGETWYSMEHLHPKVRGSEPKSSFSLKNHHRKRRSVTGSVVQRRVSFKDTPILHRRIGSSSPAIDASKRITIPLQAGKSGIYIYYE